MARNDAHCARAVEVIAGNIVGTGIVPSVQRSTQESTQDKMRAERLAALWSEWCETSADIEGAHTYQAIESVAGRGWVEAGECFIRRHTVPAMVATGRVPLQLEVLEADLVDEQKNQQLADGGRVVQGVEFDARGERVAYWFLPEHPGESYPFRAGRLPSVRVPASDVIHLFVPLRPRQVRGIPFLTPGLAMKADLETWERFELARKQTEAAVAAFIVPGDDAAEQADEGLVPAAIDDDGNRVEDIQPRMIVRLRNGKDVRFNTPVIAANYDTYKRSMLQSCAVSWMLSYEWLSGDLSQANYSSLRGGLIEFWRYVETLQYTHFVPKVSARVWRWFCEAAFLGGFIDRPFVAADFTAPARQSVDPARESLGDILDTRAGFVPWESQVAKRGFVPRSNLEQQSRLTKELDLLGLILDIDPSKVDWRGAMRNDQRGGAGGAPPQQGETDDAGSDL
jgi:lambda family phage portal protein